MERHLRSQGFTFIELSIVLVIVGLIVGGILTGSDLIRAAEVRAQITQIEKYNAAVNTFRGKYGGLPGDLNLADATRFGFVVTYCDGTAGYRNGDGLIDGGPPQASLRQGGGETGLFWVDLSSTVPPLIDQPVPQGGVAIDCFSAIGTAGTGAISVVSNFLPQAKIGRTNYVQVYEASGFNWYAVSAVTGAGVVRGGSVYVQASTNLSVKQAYDMDKKIDDGLPTSGTVQANYLNGSVTSVQRAPNSTTAGGDATSCFDTTTGTYSVTVNNGTGTNCALSFKMQ